jgi:hypothetical protein
MKEYALNSKDEIAIQEKLLQNDLLLSFSDNDHSWDSNFVKEAILGKDPETASLK